MRAFRVTQAGTAPTLETVARPVAGPGEVLVRVAACGLNFADLLMIKGDYQDTPPAPFTLGMEIAGVVEALGPGVTAPLPGTRIAAFIGQGGLADYCAVDAARAVPIPDTLSFAAAAGFIVAYGTSHLALTRRAGLRPDERLLVLGAAGGVGLTAVELGAAIGAEVIAVARGADKLAVAHKAGARHLIDSDAGDIRAAVRALGGADVVYDAVGGPAFDAALRATNPEGRILCIGFASGTVPQIPANILLVKNITVMGFYWGGYLRFAPEVLTASLATVMDLQSQGRIHPHVGATYPLERAADALELLRSRKSTGKVVVTL